MTLATSLALILCTGIAAILAAAAISMALGIDPYSWFGGDEDNE